MFVENAVEETAPNGDVTATIDKWNDGDELQLCREAMNCLGYECYEITKSCLNNSA